MQRASSNQRIRACAATLAMLAAAPALASQEGRPSFRWDAEHAEHLWNRAGFGAAPEDVERAVAAGLEGFVAQLLTETPRYDEPFYARLRGSARETPDDGSVGSMSDMADMEPTEMAAEERGSARRREMLDRRREDALQLRDFLSWWLDRMVEGQDPLREKMTLFWHGHFTSSMQDVKNSHEMIVQNQLLRRHALGRFRELLRAIVRDPAMLEYLDNDSNRRGSPNENFARELLELFTLGEGNYTEQDIKEVARAFTGWTDRHGEFVFEPRRHDHGEKTVLGVTGRLDGDDVLDIVLARPECARYLAGKMLRWFEGIEPEPERLERYAVLLTDLDYHVGAFLGRLFTDPEFYRPEVRGTRIAGPIDYVVGCARRLRVEPPAELLGAAAAMLGQRLFYPPNVKGWEEGAAWITTSSLMHRSNLVGVMLGQVGLEDFLAEQEAMEEMAAMAALADDDDEAYGYDEMGSEDGSGRSTRGLPSDDRALRELKRLERREWRPRLNLTATLHRTGATSDREIVGQLASRLLAVPLGAGARERLVELFAREREAIGVSEGRLAELGLEGEELLRRFAHVVVSLPEAQLH